MKKLILILSLISADTLFAMQSNYYTHCARALREHNSEYFREFSGKLTLNQVEDLLEACAQEVKKLPQFHPDKEKMTQIYSALFRRKNDFYPPPKQKDRYGNLVNDSYDNSL